MGRSLIGRDPLNRALGRSVSAPSWAILRTIHQRNLKGPFRSRILVKVTVWFLILLPER